jgi:hypothetical protein
MGEKHVTKSRCLFGGFSLVSCMVAASALPFLLMAVAGLLGGALPWLFWAVKDTRTRWRDVQSSQIKDALTEGVMYSVLGGWPFLLGYIVLLVVWDQFR